MKGFSPMPNKRNGQPAMPRKRKPVTPDSPEPYRQYKLKLKTALAARIDDTADGRGIDPVDLIRLILKDHIAEYEAQANKNRDNEPKS
jgi:hypothetical protein